MTDDPVLLLLPEAFSRGRDRMTRFRVGNVVVEAGTWKKAHGVEGAGARAEAVAFGILSLPRRAFRVGIRLNPVHGILAPPKSGGRVEIRLNPVHGILAPPKNGGRARYHRDVVLAFRDRAVEAGRLSHGR